MKSKLILSLIFISMIGHSQNGWHRHTFYKVDYHDNGSIGYSFDKVQPAMNSFNLMLYSKGKEVLTYEMSGKINIYDTTRSIQSLLNMIGNLYDEKQKLQAQDKALYSMMILVKDGQVTDKEKWNKLLAEYLKQIEK